MFATCRDFHNLHNDNNNKTFDPNTDHPSLPGDQPKPEFKPKPKLIPMPKNSAETKTEIVRLLSMRFQKTK